MVEQQDENEDHLPEETMSRLIEEAQARFDAGSGLNPEWARSTATSEVCDRIATVFLTDVKHASRNSSDVSIVHHHFCDEHAPSSR